jgi:hypothetical protein
MKLIKSLLFFCILIVALNNCSGFSDAKDVLTNQKTSSTDEFLIKKKGALTQPPDFESVPEPGSFENKADQKEESIDKLLKTSKSDDSKALSTPSSVESSILSRIKK